MPSLLCRTLCNTIVVYTFLNYFLLERICISKPKHLRVFGSGGLAVGSHPIPFRTRKLSPLAAMVLRVTPRESS